MSGQGFPMAIVIRGRKHDVEESHGSAELLHAKIGNENSGISSGQRGGVEMSHSHKLAADASRASPTAWVPQPNSGAWTHLLDVAEVTDEEYPLPMPGRALEFAVSTRAPASGSSGATSTGLRIRRDLPMQKAARHLGSGRYHLIGEVVYLGERREIGPESAWQSQRNCIVDVGIRVFADIKGVVPSDVGSPAEGSVDLQIDYAVGGTPLPMIYWWQIVTTGRFDLGFPHLVWSRLLDTPPSVARHDYTIVLKKTKASPERIAAVAEVTNQGLR